MKKLLTSLAIATLACGAAHAQTDPKTEWATKVVTLQQGPELDRLVAQLTASTTQDLIANWGPRLEANVPKARQQKASEDLNVELKDIAAFFDSPAVKKYQAAAPELGNLFVQKLVEASRADVLARVKQFDDTAVKIVGTAPAAPASPAAAKPPAKK